MDICVEKEEADLILTNDLGFGDDCIPGTKDDPTDTVEGAMILDAVEARCNSWPNDLNFDGAEYEAQTAFCKQQQNWAKIRHNDVTGQLFDGLAALPFFLQDANLTFDFVGDEMPPNRNKIIHPTGVVALFKYVSSGDHDFNGAFKGTDHGLMRISEVGSPVQGAVASTSAGFKFFRDGVESANMMTLHSFDGHATYNFLDVDYNTHVLQSENECKRMTG